MMSLAMRQSPISLGYTRRHNICMPSAQAQTYTAESVARMSPAAIARTLRELVEALAEKDRQLAWFKRQVFGSKSERLQPVADAQQLNLGEIVGELPVPPQAPKAGREVAGHTRRAPARDCAGDADVGSFFDPAQVEVQVINVPCPEAQGLRAQEYEVIGEKVSYRLAQRPGAYVALKYVRPVIKLRSTGTLHCAPAPASVFDGSRADVSVLAGMAVDKFRYHLPLYRLHQRLLDAGFKLSRPWLTQCMQKVAEVLAPIVEAQLASILGGHVITMDETPIKAGRAAAGRMKATYFWPVYGENDEVCFPHFASRRHEHVREVLGQLGSDTVLLSDGYAAYACYAMQTGVTHAQCWAHARRMFFEAQDAEPQAAAEALAHIGALYRIEAEIRDAALVGAAKLAYRATHSRGRVEAFFAWVEQRFAQQGLLPKNPLTKALAYVRERRRELSVFVGDAGVPIDTNHLERALRPIPMGRRNWLFCWSEVGARHVGIMQSLIATCVLQGVDPYTYLVDVLQRVGRHPASRVAELTPRLWKQHFRHTPLRSDLHVAAALAPA